MSFGKPSPTKALFIGPAEPVKLIVHLNQITVIVIPHGTNRALEIRTMMRSKVRTTDGKEIFVFNGEDGSWSTVCRTSTASNPVLTASPFDACEKVLSVMRACKAVSKVTISDESGVEISLEQVRTMQFVPIEESAVVDSETDEVAEAVLELNEKTARHDEDISSLKAKLARAEDEISTLSATLFELQGVVNGLVAAAPPPPSAEDVVEVKQEVAAPPAKRKAPQEPGRLARAAAKKRTPSE